MASSILKVVGGASRRVDKAHRLVFNASPRSHEYPDANSVGGRGGGEFLRASPGGRRGSSGGSALRDANAAESRRDWQSLFRSGDRPSDGTSGRSLARASGASGGRADRSPPSGAGPQAR